MKNDGYYTWFSQGMAKIQPTFTNGNSLRNYRINDEKSHPSAQPKINLENKQTKK